MPEARPQYGLPYQQLPATRVTPESTLNEQIQVGRQQIQNRFNLQWKEIQRSMRFVGRTKSQRMLQDLHIRAKQEMLQLNQKAQAQMNQLRNIDRLAQQGAIPNPDEIKARIAFGSDVAKSMYPEPERERTIPQQFGELDVYSHRISQELERFQIVGGKVPSKFLSRLKGISPLATAISALRGPPKGRKGELHIFDYNIPAKDPKTGEDVMGDWRKAEPGEIGIYQAWLQEERDVAARKRELLGQPDISRRRAQPGVARSGFDAGVTESIPKPAVERRQQPTSVELRQRGTREAYEQGKRLGYWR